MQKNFSPHRKTFPRIGVLVAILIYSCSVHAGFSMIDDESLPSVGDIQKPKVLHQSEKASREIAVAAITPIPTPIIVIKPSFSVLPADMNVRGTLRRWMKVAGYQEVVWDLRDDIPADRELAFEGDLNAALLGLMQALKTGPAPARACVYTNRVVRVIPATRFCEEPSL